MDIEQVAVFRSPLTEKFGLPRQAGLAPSLRGRIEFLPGYNAPEAFRGLEGFERLWIVWEFNLNRGEEWHPTVRPPRLGGNERIGVWASRSPYRPNPLGLSCVKIEAVNTAEGIVEVSGADLADGTPIYDVKPYLAYSDAHPEAVSGFAGSAWEPLKVVIPEQLAASFPQEEIRALEEILAQDPRPAYQDDPEREYGLSFAGRNVRFKVKDGVLTVAAVL